MRIVLSDKADSDLLRIYRCLGERSPAAADTFIQRIDANLKNLARFPFIGRERSSLAAGLRSLVVGLYLVFYVVEAEQIVVVRVIDGRMDVEEEFHR
jgi:toxin ParE1/3/4